MNLAQFAALFFTLLSIGVCVFQVALILGAPWGELTLGGRWRGALPWRTRAIPLVSLLIFAGLNAIVLARSGLTLPDFHAPSRSLIWAVVVYCGFGCLLNAITPSPRERAIWLPVVAGLFATSLGVALSH